MFAALALVVNLSSADAFHHYRQLLISANWGWDEREQAAFLVRTTDGGLRAHSWHSFDNYRASYRGRVPSGCVAIVHTHPGRDLFPSDHDRALSRRLNIPVIVVTVIAVTVAYPDGAIVQLAEGVWFKRSTIRPAGLYLDHHARNSHSARVPISAASFLSTPVHR